MRYWSSTEYNANSGWRVLMSNGQCGFINKFYDTHVRLVRTLAEPPTYTTTISYTRRTSTATISISINGTTIASGLAPGETTITYKQADGIVIKFSTKLTGNSVTIDGTTINATDYETVTIKATQQHVITVYSGGEKVA